MRLLILFLAVFIFAEDKYKLYVDKLVNYHFSLDYNFSPPFERKRIKNKELKKAVKSISVKLISILNDEALIIVNFYKNYSLVMSKKMWVKKGKKIEDCIVKDIYLDKIVLKCGKKNLIKTLNLPLKIKEKRW